MKQYQTPRSMEQKKKEAANKEGPPALKTSGVHSYDSDKKLAGPDRPST